MSKSRKRYHQNKYLWLGNKNIEPCKTMTVRKQEMFDMIIHYDGYRVEWLDKKVLKKLLNDGKVYLENVLWRIGYSHTYANPVKEMIPQPIVKRISEPYKKRKADMKLFKEINELRS